VHEAWPLACACISGGMLTSYNKARAGMERPVSNVAWPDLFERFERVATLCVGLFVSSHWPQIGWLSLSTLTATLAAIALLTHVSALQRFFRARRLLS
jgi:hypothetical protein